MKRIAFITLPDITMPTLCFIRENYYKAGLIHANIDVY